MNEKKYTFLVEVIYAQVVTVQNEDKTYTRKSEIEAQVFSFSDDKQDIAKRDAQRYMDKVIRYGLDLHGGSILKTVILPSSIYQVGLVDYNKYEQEQKLGIDTISTPVVEEGVNLIEEDVALEQEHEALPASV
jgi:hypothetical protein